METKAIAIAAAALGLCLSAEPARAQSQGIITCQITLSQFAEDVLASKARLSPRQLDDARQIVDVGRSQCRSDPNLVLTDIRSARTAMPLQSGARVSGNFSDFWPARPEELSSLSE